MIDTKALRSRILDLAIQGKLTEQLPSDGTAEELYQQIKAEKQALIKEGKIKKEKLLPPIKPDEIPFEIPGSWKWLRFSEICLIINGDRGKNYPAKSSLKKDGIPFISALNLNGKGINVDDNLLCLSDEQYERLGNGKLIKDDTAICIRGSLGKHGRYPFEKGAIASSLVITRFFIEKQTLGNFEMLWLDSTLFPLEIKKYDSGTAQPNLAAENLSKFLYPFPPLAEQKRIVERVEEIFRLLDTIDQAQEKYAEDAQILKAKLITAGIQGKLTEQLDSDGTADELYQQIQEEKKKLIKEGKLKKEKPLQDISDEEIPFEIPGNWKWVRLNEITSKISSGSTPAGGKKGNAYVEEGYCFFREQNIYNDGIHYDGMVYISEELLYTRENSTVLPNDILLNITGGSIGRCAVIPDDFCKGSINQHILIIRLIDVDMIHYIHTLICSPYYQRIIQSKVVGDKDGFSGGRCKATLIPLPPLAEQKRIAEVLERVVGVLG